MVDLFRSDLLDRAGFPIHGFTARTGGSSSGPYTSLNLAHDVGDDPGAVASNIEALRTHLGVDDPLARVRQVHGRRVVDGDEIAQPWTAEPVEEGDAIVSSGTGAVLAVQTADCAAVLLADPTTRVVAAAHAGWRGLARGVIRAAIGEMERRGARARSVIAAIGPHICARCYEVGPEVARRFPESAEPIGGPSDRFLLDLALAIEVSLISAGLTSSNIDRVGPCTRCSPGDLFSHRGSGGRCGRGLGLVSAARGSRGA